ncbi:MAG TPA: PQQ-binding-like beta-propeller repeat protein [Pirellulales bacterium]|jgi:outer membrane protein assembly factor BamB|nr:PQQ-binding-like beta-propeller repeat protein [Pirellulales bacterium]
MVFVIRGRAALATCLTASLFVCLAVASQSSGSTEGNWPQWRGPNRDNVSTETGLLKKWPVDGPPLAWTAKDLGIGFSGVSVQNGRIYTMGERDTGETPKPKETAAAKDQDTKGKHKKGRKADRGGKRQFVVALNEADGKQLWATPIGTAENNGGGYSGPRCTPAADGAHVYALGIDGDLACLDSATGEIVWKKSYTKDFDGRMMTGWGYAESPLVDGDRLICTPGGKKDTMVALDKLTGKTIWTCAAADFGHKGKDGAAYSSIVISHGAGVKQYVQLIGHGLIGVRADDGQFLWGYDKVANGTANIPTPIVRGDYVFDSTGYQTGAALLKLTAEGSGVKAEEVYFLDHTKLQIHHGGMVLVGGYLYGGHGHNAGAPVCVDFLTGKIEWKENHGPGSGSAAVACADGRLYFRYQDGTMALIDCTPKEYKLVSSFKIPDVSTPSWPHPVIAGGRMYIRDQQRLLCYDLKASDAK